MAVVLSISSELCRGGSTVGNGIRSYAS